MIKLADDDEYKNFYQAVKDAFPEVPEDKLLFAFNVAAVEHDIHYDVLTDGMIKLKDLLKESIDLQNFKDLVYRYTHRERDSRYEILHQIVLGFEALQSHDDKTEAIELLKQADLYKYVQDGLTEAVSPHDQALSYTEEQALELTHKNWGSFTGKVCNSGFCDIYADKLSKLLPGSKKWDTEEQGSSGTLGHVWVEFKGKFYDAETPDGVSDWKELPWMQSFYKAKKQYPSDIKKL